MLLIALTRNTESFKSRTAVISAWWYFSIIDHVTFPANFKRAAYFGNESDGKCDEQIP